MKLKPNATITKGMVFAGCSFTWGQGLYYYSGLDTLQEPPPNHYHHELVTAAHERYMETVRFPRLVVNHFNTFELCQPFNGGASYSIHDWWNRSFMPVDHPDKTKANFNYPIPTYDYSEVSHVFYQFTQWHRAQSSFRPNGHPITHCDAWQTPGFHEWLTTQNITLQEYESQSRKKELEDAKEFLKQFTNRGIKVYVICWPEDLIDDILQDEWLASRFVKFNYKNKQFNSIQSMMDEQAVKHGPYTNPELTIVHDTDYFEQPPQDHHPSLVLHKVIADSIIEHLKKENQ